MVSGCMKGICPPGKKRGLGVRTWYAQRLSALALIPLSFCVLGSFLCLVGHGRDSVERAFKSPVLGGLLVVFLGCGFYHGALGLGEIIEDYVHQSCMKKALKALVNLGSMVLFLLGFLALVKLFWF